MKTKTKEEMSQEIQDLGACAVSKFSSINHLCKLKMPLQGMIMTEASIRHIECTLWSLPPIAMNRDLELLKTQINVLNDAVNRFVDAARLMALVMNEGS